MILVEGVFRNKSNKHTGWVLLSKENCNPIIIAPGHQVSLASSIEIVKHCLRGYKLPEPTRQAHNYVNTVKREMKACNLH